MQRHLRTLHAVPVQPELHVQVFGLVQVPFTHAWEQIAKDEQKKLKISRETRMPGDGLFRPVILVSYNS